MPLPTPTLLKNLHIQPGDAHPAPKEFKLLGLQWESDGSCRLLVLAVPDVDVVDAASTAARALFPTTTTTKAPAAGRPS